ncbi:MAG TPA: hypothetical protein VGN11_04200, partial [Candidatus Baltobacteraceae bacterium]|nr:hypothetical protein [Candidatus Baltobacteraceae bacterium]
ANTYTAQYCTRSGGGAKKTRALLYWVRYTPPAALTAFTRYDGSVAAYDDASPAAYNATHDELYAGDVALTKSFTVVSNGCPAGATPVYSALGVCPGGVLRYTIDYRNIVAGGGAGTEGNITSIFANAISAGGSLVLTDDGTLSGVSQTTTPNWSTFTNGLSKALQSGITNTSCGSGANACGDTTSGTTYTYDALHASGIGATKFTATIGGAAFTLYPVGVGGQIGQGTITFAVTVK